MLVFSIRGTASRRRDDLVTALVSGLAARAVRIGVIETTGESLTVDAPGKDTDRHRLAGAADVVAVSGCRWGRVHETGAAPPLDALTAQLGDVDVALLLGPLADDRAPALVMAEARSGALKLVSQGAPDKPFHLDNPQPIIDVVLRLLKKTG